MSVEFYKTPKMEGSTCNGCGEDTTTHSIRIGHNQHFMVIRICEKCENELLKKLDKVAITRWRSWTRV